MTFFIGNCEVFADLNRIRRGDDVLEVEPRVMAVLEELAREPGRVVTRDDLHRTVWSDVIVTDDALTRCIRELRRILGDDARAPKYIETISKRGYRLIAPVTSRDAAAADAPDGAEVTILASTLLGHRAEVAAAGDPVTLQRENVTLAATPRGGRYDIRTRVFTAATPLLFAMAAFLVTAMLLYGRGMQYSHGVGMSLIAAAAGAIAGMPARRRALDRSRAAIAAFARRARQS
jgi:DNA-binding winged helix-turn-helix (wHTH) protein